MLKESFSFENEKTEADLLVEKRDRLKKETEEHYRDLEILSEEWRVINEAKEEEIGPYFRKMTSRIFEETAALDEIEDTIGKNNLLNGLASPEFPTKVEFEKEENKKNEKKEESPQWRTGGTHNPKTGEITIVDKMPSLKDIWLNLTISQKPEVLKILDHELIHFKYKKGEETKKQHLKESIDSFKLFIRGGFFGSSTLLAERLSSFLGEKRKSSRTTKSAVLWSEAEINLIKTANKLRSFLLGTQEEFFRKKTSSRLKSELVATKAGRVFNKNKYKTTSIIRTLSKAYGFDNPNEIDQIIIGSQAIDRLRALGLSDSKIAEMFARDDYNSNTASFPSIDSEIENMAKQKNLSMEDVDTKVDLMRIEKETHLYEAAKIAQEELSQFAKDKKAKETI